MFRLLPLTIVTALMLLCFKLVEVVRGTDSIFISSVVAQQPERPKTTSTERPETTDKAVKAKDLKRNEDVTKKPEDSKKDEAGHGGGEKKEAAHAEGEGGHGGGEKKEKPNPNVSDSAGEVADHRYTAVEVELLQNLSKRREELNVWEKNIQIKEAALNATQKRIEEKVEQIENMKKEVSALLAQYNTQEDAKIRSLVKIYESMKPAEAARIFDEVEMPILLLVIDAMAEKKAAPILAAMNPKKAKQLTVDLANERKLNSNKINLAAGQSAGGTTAPTSDTATTAPTSNPN